MADQDIRAVVPTDEPAQRRGCTSCGATRAEYDRDPRTRQVCPMRDAQPIVGQIWEWRGTERPRQRYEVESTEPAAVTLIPCDRNDRRPFVKVGHRTLAAEYDLVTDDQPDVAPGPDADAGEVGDEVYLAAAKRYCADNIPADLYAQATANDPDFRAAIDAARAPLLAELAEARDQVAALETYRQRAIETSNGFHAGAVKLIEERDQLRAHILDIDAHATPYGDLPDDPGYVGVYLVTAGALHRALGKIGHTAPSCRAEAQLAEAIRERDEARAKTDGGEWQWGVRWDALRDTPIDRFHGWDEEKARHYVALHPGGQVVLIRRWLGPDQLVTDDGSAP